MNTNNDGETKTFSTGDEIIIVNTILSYVVYALSKAARDNNCFRYLIL